MKDNVFKKIKKFFNEIPRTPRDYAGLNSFAFFDKSGNILNKWLHEPCYYILSYGYTYPEAVYFVDRPLFPKEMSKNQWEYLNFIINFSAWSDAHLLKDPDLVYKYGSVLDANLPAQYIINAATLIRSIDEKEYIVENWALLKDHINPDAAIALSYVFNIVFNNSLERGYHNSGHMVFTGNDITPNLIWNVMKHNFKTNRGPMNKNTNYSGLADIWKHKNPYSGKNLCLNVKMDQIELNTLGLPFKIMNIEKDDIPEYLTKIMNLNFGADYAKERLHRQRWA